MDKDDAGGKKLDAGQKHILNLIVRDRDAEGWTKVSGQLFPHIRKWIPPELIEIEASDIGGRARLSSKGQEIINAMEYL